MTDEPVYVLHEEDGQGVPPPADAITAAAKALRACEESPEYIEMTTEDMARLVLEAGLPAIAAQAAAAERERIRRGAGRMPGEDWYDVPADLLDAP